MPTLDRLIAVLMLWGIRGALAWFIAYEYTTTVREKLEVVTRALAKF
ncbi:hypothetical protein MXD81_58965 [Microbacteriaceae bacterium K1510]|nr:hypothetical protein [Microbacteriaceae bacterium K1510]